LTREVGAHLAENSPKANSAIFERFRAVLNEGTISHRVQYMIEVLMQVRKDKYKDNPVIPEGLDLVEEEDQITHTLNLEDDLQVQEGLSALVSALSLISPDIRACRHLQVRS
jgi:pre-mRNA-splicing factor CWC22